MQQQGIAKHLLTISIFFDLILDRSKISLIRVSSILLAFWIFLAFSATSSGISPRRINSFNPIIVLMGVRISWLMLEKKLFSALFNSSISFFCRLESSFSFS